jgi:hypothetical protein
LLFMYIIVITILQDQMIISSRLVYCFSSKMTILNMVDD